MMMMIKKEPKPRLEKSIHNKVHSLERAAAGIDQQVNVDKTEYMCFNQRGNVSTISGQVNLKNSALETKMVFQYVSIFYC